jgi:hypothetical protein
LRRILFSAALLTALALACSSESSESCGADTDCSAGACVDGTCTPSTARTCTTVAAGGGAKLCDGEPCATGDACVSGACTPEGKCGVSPGKSCGVGLAVACGPGEACQQDADCVVDYCDKVCAPVPANVHEDGRRNGGETGTDCGGAATDRPCPEGQKCTTSADCQGVCNGGGTCEAPTATDGKKNGDESDVDCGGASAPRCALGKACNANGDCQLLACTGGACVKPSATDGVANGSETDVDCGGAGVAEGDFTYTAPRCNDEKACALPADCKTLACSPGGKCALPSCSTVETAGITSCGAKETGDATAAHQSCCTSLPLPTRTTRRLDKYEITSGRMRTFLAAVGPNVRAFVTGHVAAKPASQLAALVALNPTIASLYPASASGPLNVVAHMALDIDNYGGYRGCYNSTGGYAANTYWQDAASLSQYGIPARSLPRAESDQKPLNCAMPIMYAAFCAWDGGELATLADYFDAWPQAYPWGAADIGRPNYNWCNANGIGFTCFTGQFYEWPQNTNIANDLEVLIGAPGRFVNDATLLKSKGESWMDLYANLAEYTGDFAASAQDFCDFSGAPAGGAVTCTRALKAGTGTQYTAIPSASLIGNTWEGHAYGRNTSGAARVPVTFQYGKFGGRCVRPAQ